MSVLGNRKAPYHRIYNSWLIALGIAIPICTIGHAPAIAAGKADALSISLFYVLNAYAVGGCILAGLFPVGESKSLETLSAKIHGYGSAVGFLLLMSAPLLVGLYLFKRSDGMLGTLSVICFACAAIFFSLFVMADKPRYRGSVIELEGLWQRLSLFFMYLPIAILFGTTAGE